MPIYFLVTDSFKGIESSMYGASTRMMTDAVFQLRDMVSELVRRIYVDSFVFCHFFCAKISRKYCLVDYSLF